MKINKSIIALSLSLLIGVIFFLLYQKYNELNKHTTDAIQVIPLNSAVIIETEDWEKSLEELENSTLWQSISNSNEWKKIKQSIYEISSVIENNETLEHFINKQKLYLSIHHSTNDYYVLLSTTCTSEELTLIQANDTLMGKFKTREYDGVNIFELENNWNLCHHHNLLFMSSSPLLIEDGIRQLNNKISLLDNNAFKKVQNTKSTFARAHIYLNYENLSKLIYQNSKLKKSDQKWMSRWANWAELDLEISNNNLTFSGFTLVEDSSSNYLTALFGQLEQKIEISKIAPRNTNKIIALGIQDVKTFYSNYKEFLAKHNNLYEHNKAITTINSTHNIDIENILNNIILNELGSISTFSSSGKTENYIFIKAKKESEELINHINSSIDNSNFSEKYRGYELSKFKINNIFKILYGHLFSSVNENYFTWIDGYLIFANSNSSLKAFINNFLSKKVLDNDATFIKFKDQIGSRCNFLYYTNPSYGTWNESLNNDWKSYSNQENWSNVSGFVYQLSSKNELFYNNVVLHYESNVAEETQLDWIVNLEHNIAIPPQIVFNHSSRKNNIIIQDDNKNIYLINEKGKRLWKKQLGGLILDQINQLDYYKNGKLQYIFNTEDSLYILDRLGRNVENFPIELNSKAERGHTLVDYDKNRKYRVLIPSEDGMVYNFNKKGEKVIGWKFEKMNKSLIHQVRYLNISGKDYLYVIDSNGNTNIVGRNGKKRIQTKKIPITNSFYLDKKSGDIYSSDKKGNVWLTTLKGSQTKIKTSEFTEYNFYASNINDDELMDLFISDNYGTKCYNLETEILDFDMLSESQPKVFNFNKLSIIGLSSEGSCHLFTSDGKVYSGSPLFGGGDFEVVDLDKDSKLNLIVINENILNNYSLE